MGLLSNIKAASLAPALRSLPASVNAETARITGINPFGLFGWSSLEVVPADNPRLLALGYMSDHYVFIVADWKARQFAKAKPIVYEIKDKKHYSIYKSLTPLQKADSYVLRKKSIEEIDDESDRLVKTLREPNPYQSWYEFAYGFSVYYDFGNALVYGVGPEKGANAGQFHEMYLLPTSVYGGKDPDTTGFRWYVDSTGANKDIDGKKVLHVRQFNPDPFAQGGKFWGMSKLAPARNLLAKSRSSVEAEAEMMQNRGAKTIIFPKNVSPSEQDFALQGVRDATNDVRKKLKQAGTGGVAGVNVEIGSIELGMTPVELNIIESNKLTRGEYCALWHVDEIAIFSAVSEASRANAETAVKSSLNTGVLPDQTLLASKLNQWLLPAYNAANKYQRYVDFNTDVYPELQTNKKEIADWADAVPLTGDQRLELFGWEATGLPEMQVPLITSRLQPVSDFLAPKDDEIKDPKNDGTY